MFRSLLRCGCPLALAIILAAGGTSREAVAHVGTAPRLDPAQLDDGMYIALHHPRVIRDADTFEITLVVENMAGDAGAEIEEVRYLRPAPLRPVRRIVQRRLPTKRSMFDRLIVLERALDHAVETGDHRGFERAIAERWSLLGQMAGGAFVDTLTVRREEIPLAGSAVDVVVEVDVVRGGAARTIRRPLSIPVHAPLPTGGPVEERLRYDVGSGAFTVMPADAGPAGSGVRFLAGDQHLHTRYSIDAFFLYGTTANGAGYAAVADLLGLDWCIITDHSNVQFDLLGPLLAFYTPTQFSLTALEVAAYTAENDFLALAGQELGVAGSGPLELPSHYLAYPAEADTTGYLANPCTGLPPLHLAACEPQQTIIDRVTDAGGLGFIAHPTLDSVLNLRWDFSTNSTGWAGVEVWNGGFGAVDQAAVEQWHGFLSEVPRAYSGRLVPRPMFPGDFPVAIASSDAHATSQIGVSFTYAMMGEATRENVAQAFRAGRCVASNGPLLYGQVAGAGLGEVAAGCDVDCPVEVTLHTTPEFGPVGNYLVTLFVNGLPRVVLAPSGSGAYSTTVTINGLRFARPDRFITIRAESVDGLHSALTNPIWIGLPRCPGDVNGDDAVDVTDVLLLLGLWGACPDCPADFDGDGIVGPVDFLILLANWQACP